MTMNNAGISDMNVLYYLYKYFAGGLTIEKNFFGLVSMVLTALAMTCFAGCGGDDASGGESGEETASGCLAGSWRQDGAEGTNVITVDKNGCYVLYHTRGGVLSWTDNKENAGKDMYFSYPPGQD